MVRKLRINLLQCINWGQRTGKVNSPEAHLALVVGLQRNAAGTLHQDQRGRNRIPHLLQRIYYKYVPATNLGTPLITSLLLTQHCALTVRVRHHHRRTSLANKL